MLKGFQRINLSLFFPSSSSSSLSFAPPLFLEGGGVISLFPFPGVHKPKPSLCFDISPEKWQQAYKSAVLHKECLVIAVYILEGDIHAAVLFCRGRPWVTRCASCCFGGWINFAGSPTMTALVAAPVLSPSLSFTSLLKNFEGGRCWGNQIRVTIR